MKTIKLFKMSSSDFMFSTSLTIAKNRFLKICGYDHTKKNKKYYIYTYLDDPREMIGDELLKFRCGIKDRYGNDNQKMYKASTVIKMINKGKLKENFHVTTDF